MGCTRREFLALASASAAVGLAACTPEAQPSEPAAPEEPGEKNPDVDLSKFESLSIDASKWHYDEDNDVYYQLGLTYCLSPATETYESLAIFVPGSYFTAEKKGDTYACAVNEKAVVGSFTPATAPILMPINTGTLSAQMSPTVYGYEGSPPTLRPAASMSTRASAAGPPGTTPPRAPTSSFRAAPPGRSSTSRRPSATCATTPAPFRATRAASLSLGSRPAAA